MLRTVRVPPEIAPRFGEVEELVSRFFRERRDDPERGTIEIFGERYVLVRAASLSVEFFALVSDLFGQGREAEAEAFASNILFDLAHAIGRSDAQNFHARMSLDDPIARLSAGPIHFAHAGWAFVDILPESRPVPDREFCLVYDHPYSFESDAWVRAGVRREHPACIMNAGYSSGWCEASFDIQLVAAELLCRARGDECCRFLMAHPERIEAFLDRYLEERPSLAGRAPAPSIPDFFARKRMEEELRRARDELELRVAERTMELRESNERLRREMSEREEVEKKLRQAHKLEAIGRLAGGIAHDFNNLLGVVLGHSSMLLRRTAAEDPVRFQLEEIARAAEQAARLTHQLLTFSRGQVIARELLDLNRIVADMDRMLSRLIGEDVEVVTLLGDDAGLIEADRGQIEQVIVNLAVNARDAMPAGGTLTIATEAVVLEPVETLPRAAALRPGRYARLCVSDTGSGMDEATLGQIFDPFFTTKEDGKGTGLGLSTVYGIVTQAGGAINVSSTPGRGSSFVIHLPRAEPQVQDGPWSESPLDSLRGGGETLLVVEDQDALRAVVARSLAEYGYTVLEAADAAGALALTERHRGEIHLLVTDVVLPRMGGPELSERFAALRPRTRVLYMSGYAEDPRLRRGVAERRAHFIQKPFTPRELVRRVREILRDPAPG